MGLEPMTSSLPRMCSTTELQQRKNGHINKAGEGNRTLVFSLEGCCTTIVLHPQSQLGTGRDFSCSKLLALCSPKWGLLDSNQCRRSQRIYSPPPLTTRANPRICDPIFTLNPAVLSVGPLFVQTVQSATSQAVTWKEPAEGLEPTTG